MNEVHLTDEEKFGLSKEDIQTAEQRKTNEEEAKSTVLQDEEHLKRLKELEEAIQEKARFLIQLDCPEHFKSSTCDLDDELKKLNHG